MYNEQRKQKQTQLQSGDDEEDCPIAADGKEILDSVGEEADADRTLRKPGMAFASDDTDADSDDNDEEEKSKQKKKTKSEPTKRAAPNGKGGN